MLDKKYLFACCIIDGALNDMSEERRTKMVREITYTKEDMLKNSQPTGSDQKITKKVSK